MIVSYNNIPVAEEILAERLRTYFSEKIGWKNLYPQHGRIKISNEFPWVPYLDGPVTPSGYPDLSQSKDLFPSITVVNTQDRKSTTVLERFSSQILYANELNDFKQEIADLGIVISPEGLQAIETYFQTNNELIGSQFIYQKTDIINIDITVNDYTDVKNRLYDLVELFLVGQEAVLLKEEKGIAIQKESINGNRSGTYNVDFGMVLRGSTIQFSVDYNISQVYYDIDGGLIESVSIDHSVSVLGE